MQRALAVPLIALLCACTPSSGEPEFFHLEGSWAAADRSLINGQSEAVGRILAPILSGPTAADRPDRIRLAATLFVQNISEKPLLINGIDLMSGSGERIHRYVERPIILPPGARLRAIARPSRADDDYAHFLMTWSGDRAPMVDVVMLGSAGTHGFSLTTQGHAVD